jgi:putative sigma-54 modulation protein
MEIQTTARHFDLTPELREYSESKLRRLARYFDQIHEGTITITKEKFRYLAEINVRVGGGADLVSREETPDVYSSIDGAIDRLERQVRRHKGRLMSRRAGADKVGQTLAAEDEEFAGEEPGSGQEEEQSSA